MFLRNSSFLLSIFGSPKSPWLYQVRRSFYGDIDQHGSLNIDFSSSGLAKLHLSKNENDYPKVILKYIRSVCSESPPQFKAIWVHVNKEYFGYISDFCLPAPQGCDMNFHHADKSSAVLYRWLSEEPCRIPEYASHQVGVAGVVLSPHQTHLLMVREKSGASAHIKKALFPTMLCIKSDTASTTLLKADAAVREVFEETGIATTFDGIMAVRQQHDHPGAFGRSDLLAICSLLVSGTQSPAIPEITMCTKELSQCSWMPLRALQKATVHSVVLDPNSPVFSNQEELHITKLTSCVVQSLLSGQQPLRHHRMESLRAGQFYDLFLPE